MSTEDKYVAAAYLVVFVVVLAWVLIMATKLGRLQRQTAELAELARRKAGAAEPKPDEQREPAQVG